ncbi:hypothetical protein ACWKSP_38910 [Micromonosporaceae bacterium Da 78-11]
MTVLEVSVTKYRHLKVALLRYWGLAAALVAGASLLFAAPVDHRPAPGPPSAAQAWPSARRGSLPANLADGTAYEPALFLDVRTSVGSAQTRDGRSLRLLLRHRDGSVRELRRLPLEQDPSFQSPTAAGDTLVWIESTHGHPRLWTMNLKAGRPRQLTADTGDLRSYQSQYDLVVAGGRVHWVAAGLGDSTEIRSVALTGGAVDVQTRTGAWALSAWPWLVDGAVAASGTSTLHDLATGQDRAVPTGGRAVTACSPLWCRVVSLARDGSNQIELVRPDGSGRRRIAAGTASTVIFDVAVLDRFELFAQISGTSDLTGNAELLTYDITTGRTVQISPEAASVSYRAGVLWWSTGTQESFLRHALDLRTV